MTAVETEITPYVLNHFIGGKTVQPASGDYLDKLDPRSGDRIARVASGNAADVDAAVQAAAAAFPEWRDRRPMDRAKVMLEMARSIRRHVKLLAEIESRENGTPAAQTPAGLETAARYFEFYAGLVNTTTARRSTSAPAITPIRAASPLAWWVSSRPGTFP